MAIFEKPKSDIAVMEVGMGGRLDATNAGPDDVVVTSALTSVDLDHQGFLGTLGSPQKILVGPHPSSAAPLLS